MFTDDQLHHGRQDRGSAERGQQDCRQSVVRERHHRIVIIEHEERNKHETQDNRQMQQQYG